MKRMQTGFTMIELIVVIVILGVLAATALPKFVDVRDEANHAARDGVLAALNSAMAINYGGCLVTNHVVTTNKCVKVDNCNKAASLLQTGLPTGYTVAGAALGANGDATVDCTLTPPTGAADNATFKGIAAGQ